jgi:hypothetical protein
MRVLYFGCVGDKGHYLWGPGTAPDYRPTWLRSRTLYQLPWGEKTDGGLVPPGTRDRRAPEGLAAIHLARDERGTNWTAIAFWDYSVDGRPGSNSVFVFDEAIDFDRGIALAKAAFPTVWARFKFEVRLNKEPA